ncbi:MAG: ABC transporter ATP-binding protein [Acidimicrobiia bacterium]|nr:ABC transporter ATP-binding protein [Acidimicrobiia bacterium]
MSDVLLDRVTKTYRRRPALQGINLRLTAGTTAIMGPNGAGKTTLLRLLATAIRPDSGQIRIHGADPNRPLELARIRTRLGYAPDGNDLDTRLSVLQFLHHVAALKGLDITERNRDIEQQIEALGLGHALHRQVRQLPTGTVRRLLVAQAMLGRPQLLVLDEPFADVDHESRHLLIDVLRRSSDHLTVVLAGHHLNDLAAIANRLVILKAGTVAFDNTPADLVAAGLATTNPDDLSPLEAGYLAALSDRPRPEPDPM